MIFGIPPGVQFAAGQFAGSGGVRTITTGFAPKVVILHAENVNLGEHLAFTTAQALYHWPNATNNYHSLTTGLTLAPTGFTMDSSPIGGANQSGTTYYWIALG